jgi:hypothetical protein
VSAKPIPPIERSIAVSWNPQQAFERFTGEFGAWWPVRTLSIGGERTKKVVFERKVGGRIYEQLDDGRRFQWGKIVIWEPHQRVKFTWHPSRSESSAQEVEVEFVPDGTGTLVKLTSRGWENWGEKAEKARKGYDSGWVYVLKTMAGQRDAKTRMLESMVRVMVFFQKFKGGRDATIASAEGEIKEWQ